ncbi:MAG: hypothetical protein HONBIEJF_00337 [Fimbriimonadaceae bacterium]|nr:hypothetical protein [Fimbriimonadaceae bacterium]
MVYLRRVKAECQQERFGFVTTSIAYLAAESDGACEDQVMHRLSSAAGITAILGLVGESEAILLRGAPAPRFLPEGGIGSVIVGKKDTETDRFLLVVRSADILEDARFALAPYGDYAFGCINHMDLLGRVRESADAILHLPRTVRALPTPAVECVELEWNGMFGCHALYLPTENVVATAGAGTKVCLLPGFAWLRDEDVMGEGRQVQEIMTASDDIRGGADPK